MHIFLKLGAPVVVGTGMAGVGGYYWFSNRETIGSSLKASIEGYQKVLFSKESTEWKEGKEVYGVASSGTISKVTKEDLPEGCENTLKLPKKDKKNYDLASEWCVVNTRTVKEELFSKGTTLLEVSASDSKGQNAGNHHNSKKAQNSNLAIGDEKVSGNSVVVGTGSEPLHNGCKERYSGPMYKLNANSEADKVKLWCSFSAGDFSTKSA